MIQGLLRLTYLINISKTNTLTILGNILHSYFWCKKHGKKNNNLKNGVTSSVRPADINKPLLIQLFEIDYLKSLFCKSKLRILN